MDYLELRKRYGDPYVSGVGVEIGAGLRPVQHEGIQKLYFFDKRNAAEFEAYFGAPPEYDLISLEGVRETYPQGLDFVTSHHVIEHIDNPIGVLSEWISLLKPGGIFYLSIPSPNNTTERRRPITPLRHILEDHFFQRGADSYESKQHLFSFIEACSASGGDLVPWFAKDGVQKFSEYVLFDIGQRDDHDSHWHTVDLMTARKMVEIAFHLSGAGSEVLVCEESDDSHYLLFRKAPLAAAPAELVAFQKAMSAVADAVKETIKPSVWSSLASLIPAKRRAKGVRRAA